MSKTTTKSRVSKKPPWEQEVWLSNLEYLQSRLPKLVKVLKESRILSYRISTFQRQGYPVPLTLLSDLEQVVTTFSTVLGRLTSLRTSWEANTVLSKSKLMPRGGSSGKCKHERGHMVGHFMPELYCPDCGYRGF